MDLEGQDKKRNDATKRHWSLVLVKKGKMKRAFCFFWFQGISTSIAKNDGVPFFVREAAISRSSQSLRFSLFTYCKPPKTFSKINLNVRNHHRLSMRMFLIAWTVNFCLWEGFLLKGKCNRFTEVSEASHDLRLLRIIPTKTYGATRKRFLHPLQNANAFDP